MKPFIGLKQIWYGEPLTSEPTSGAAVATLVEGFTEIKNVHEGTWTYTQDDPTVTEYINELTGASYYRDAETAGEKNINFSLGSYDYEDKAALGGGEVITSAGATVGWKPASKFSEIRKCVVALTKTDQFIVFSDAIIVAKVDPQQKNLALGITATALEATTSGVAAEYWFDRT